MVARLHSCTFFAFYSPPLHSACQLFLQQDVIDAERDEPMTGFDADGVMTVDGRVLLGALDNAVAGRAPGSAFHVELSQWGSCTMELKGLRDKNGGLQAITVGQRVPPARNRCHAHGAVEQRWTRTKNDDARGQHCNLAACLGR